MNKRLNSSLSSSFSVFSDESLESSRICISAIFLRAIAACPRAVGGRITVLVRGSKLIVGVMDVDRSVVVKVDSTGDDG